MSQMHMAHDLELQTSTGSIHVPHALITSFNQEFTKIIKGLVSKKVYEVVIGKHTLTQFGYCTNNLLSTFLGMWISPSVVLDYLQ